MTNEELKKKIVEVIDNWADNAVKTKRSGASVYDPYNAAELADALIAAGIGFMDDDITSQIVAIIKRDTEPITMENVALRKQVAEAKHRAEVAERALKIAEDLGELCAPAEDYMEQAEKELAEGGKDGEKI